MGSYIFTDPKGELYDDTAAYLKARGYDIKVLNLVDPGSSDTYNPLEHIKSEIDVDIIANTIIKGQGAVGTDPFWDNQGELLLKAMIYYLLATRPREEQNLASCAELVRNAAGEGSADLFGELLKDLPDDHPAKTNYKSVKLASDKTYSSILSTLQSRLGKFDSKEIANVTSTNTINFEDIARKKTALYVISSDTHTAYDFLLTIFFAQLIQQLYDFADKNGGRLPVPAYFILDEFVNIGQIPDFDKKISTSRSRGISFSVILQNLDQLKAVYEKSYETILGNCDTHLFLGSNSYSTVEYFSKQLGEKTISRASTSVTLDTKDNKTSKSTSDQIMGRALMTPDELRRMSPDDSIIFVNGLKPIKAKKYFYYTDKKLMKELQERPLSHNSYKPTNVGNWRKWNINNLYNTDIEETKSVDIEKLSLDDLFSESNDDKGTETKASAETKNVPQMNIEQETEKANVAIPNNVNVQNTKPVTGFDLEELTNTVNQNVEVNKVEATNKVEKNNEDEDVDIDIAKELEAKFEELFGKPDED